MKEKIEDFSRNAVRFIVYGSLLVLAIFAFLWIVNFLFLKDNGKKENDAQANFFDYDCEDFSSQKEAQDFFKSEGDPVHDIYNLDSDGDGYVCESFFN